MREIKFRGKRVDNGEWVYGYYFEGFTGIPYILVLHDHILGMTEFYEVDPSTVGQYTGLKDKNGRKIYKGDIVKTHYKNAQKADFVEQVVFENGKFCALKEIREGKMWSPLPDGIAHILKEVYMSECEVIGNIHDNPELLG